jgi:hypothetical protein
MVVKAVTQYLEIETNKGRAYGAVTFLSKIIVESHHDKHER